MTPVHFMTHVCWRTGGSAQPAKSERIRTVFLFTDGQATTGLTNTVQLGSILGMMLQNPVRPTIYTFGFGADYNSETLGAIAQAGQGQSSFIEDAESIAPALASALGGLMTMSAQNVELRFTPKVAALAQAHTSLRMKPVHAWASRCMSNWSSIVLTLAPAPQTSNAWPPPIVSVASSVQQSGCAVHAF